MQKSIKEVQAVAALAVLLSLACSQRPAAVPSACPVNSLAVITDSSVGPLSLGMRFHDVHDRCNVLADTIVPNWDLVESERVLVVDLALDMVTVAGSVSPLNPDQANQRISRIYVDRSTFSTHDLLRVGTTLGELRRFAGLSGGVSEASVWLSVPGHCGLGFAISNAGPFGHGSEMDWDALRRIADTTTVVRIEVDGYDCDT